MFNRILIVAVDHSFQYILAHELNEEWFETVCASDESSALRLLHETSAELLIAETVLPENSGYELCRCIRQDPQFRTLPVILMDSHFDALNQSMAFEAGADAYLSRPFVPSELVEIVGKLLEGKEGLPLDPSVFADPPAEGPDSIWKSYDNIEMALTPIADPMPLAPQPIREQPTRGLQKTLLQRAVRGRYFVLWVVLIGAALAVAGLTIPIRTQKSSTSAIQQQASGDEKAAGGSLAIAKPQPGEAPIEQEAGRENDAEPQPDGSARPDEASRVKRVEAKRASPAGRSTQPVLRSVVVRHWEPPRQYSPAVVAVSHSSEASEDEYYAPPAPPHNVSDARSQTVASPLKRSGLEMKEAGRNFGSSVKHFGESGIRAGVWTGKKLGVGAKRLGAAFKKIF